MKILNCTFIRNGTAIQKYIFRNSESHTLAHQSSNQNSCHKKCIHLCLDTFTEHVLHSSMFLCWSYCLCSQAFSSGRFLSIQRMFSSMFSRACWIHLSSAPVSARKELKKLRTWRSREKRSEFSDHKLMKAPNYLFGSINYIIPTSASISLVEYWLVTPTTMCAMECEPRSNL